MFLQMYVATCCPAKNTSNQFVTWGHSAVISPWGDVIVEAGEKEEIIYADIGQLNS